MGAPSNQILLSDFSARGCVLYNAHGRAIGPRLGLSGGSWPMLRPWQDRSQHRFLQNQVPEKQLVWTCQAGPSTSRGQVNTWWGQTWHSLSRTRWARHGLHAARGVQSEPFGLHKVLKVYSAYVFYVCTERTERMEEFRRSWRRLRCHLREVVPWPAHWLSTN